MKTMFRSWSHNKDEEIQATTVKNWEIEVHFGERSIVDNVSFSFFTYFLHTLEEP